MGFKNKTELMKLVQEAYASYNIELLFCFQTPPPYFQTFVAECQKIHDSNIEDADAIKKISAAVQAYFELIRDDTRVSLEKTPEYENLEPILKKIWEEDTDLLAKIGKSDARKYELLFGSKQDVQVLKQYFLTGERLEDKIKALSEAIETACQTYKNAGTSNQELQKYFEKLLDSTREIVRNEKKLSPNQVLQAMSTMVQALFEYWKFNISHRKLRNEYKTLCSILDKIWGIPATEREEYEESLRIRTSSSLRFSFSIHATYDVPAYIQPEDPLLKKMDRAEEGIWQKLFGRKNAVVEKRAIFEALKDKMVAMENKNPREKLEDLPTNQLPVSPGTSPSRSSSAASRNPLSLSDGATPVTSPAKTLKRSASAPIPTDRQERDKIKNQVPRRVGQTIVDYTKERLIQKTLALMDEVYAQEIKAWPQEKNRLEKIEEFLRQNEQTKKELCDAGTEKIELTKEFLYRLGTYLISLFQEKKCSYEDKVNELGSGLITLLKTSVLQRDQWNSAVECIKMGLLRYEILSETRLDADSRAQFETWVKDVSARVLKVISPDEVRNTLRR